MILEFELHTHPSETSFNSGFDKTGKLRRDKGRYFLSLNSEDQADRRQWESLYLGKNAISIDGHAAKQLAAFDMGFQEPEAKKALEELQELRNKLPALIKDADAKTSKANEKCIEVENNIDPARVCALFAEQRATEDAADMARLMAKTAERRIAALEARIKDVLRNRRKQEFERLKSLLDAEVERFNKDVAAPYARFNDIGRDLLKIIHECNHEFPPRVGYRTPTFNVADGAHLKDLTLHPAIKVLPDQLWFELRPITKLKEEK
jgi:hypothetical protein